MLGIAIGHYFMIFVTLYSSIYHIVDLDSTNFTQRITCSKVVYLGSVVAIPQVWSWWTVIPLPWNFCALEESSWAFSANWFSSTALSASVHFVTSWRPAQEYLSLETWQCTQTDKMIQDTALNTKNTMCSEPIQNTIHTAHVHTNHITDILNTRYYISFPLTKNMNKRSFNCSNKNQ